MYLYNFIEIDYTRGLLWVSKILSIYLFFLFFQEKEHKKKCLLPDDGPGAPPPGARAAPDALNSVSDSAAEAQEVPAESQTSYAQPLPVDQQQQVK